MFNKRQKDSLAKLCYDVFKLIVGGVNYPALKDGACEG